ncbi:pseudaminic acid synthase [Fulvivirga ulvae]|uniref:pseudaminic acid synthase n=1 Tax=Fulvivirga ulvae TaxID=2904245 RepID=UPI001F431BEB|nr:pseudaminic acid synthase [Fulvivirga ulvae]UII30195.1 pseudaminic acid synthase [Fulvivirga ulvae]
MEFQIDQRKVGGNNPCYIVAELSANHNQDLELAIQTIKAMKEAGADSVKIQSYTPDSITLDSDKPWFKTREDSPWAGRKLYEVYEKGATPWEWHEKLQRVAMDVGLDFFSSPFDLDFVKKLESIDIPIYKIASLEITDIPLIKAVAATGKPVIFSTGASSEEDIQLAIDTCKGQNNTNIALLKCTSAYPTPLEEVNLSAIRSIKEKYNVIVGLSDHTLGDLVPVGAVVMGAKIIEKHFILDKSIDTLDRDFSMDPGEFKTMVRKIRDMEKALGTPELEIKGRMGNATKYRRSLFAVKNIKKGELLNVDNVRSLRPGSGLHPKYYEAILGKKATEDIEKGTPLSFPLIEEA